MLISSLMQWHKVPLDKDRPHENMINTHVLNITSYSTLE